MLPTHFKVIGKIQGVQTIAANRSIRAIAYLRRKYGARNWRKRKGLAKVQLDDGTMGVESTAHLPRSGYVLCVRNENYPASLERRKLYRRLPDTRSEKHGLIRVIDESGEDYLYPADFFTSIPIPKRVRRILSRAN